MLRTELADLVARGWRVDLSGVHRIWYCRLSPVTGYQSAVSGKGETPEDALAQAISLLPYESNTEEIL